MRLLALIAFFAAGLSLALSGAGGVGRVLLALNLPGLAGPLLEDPAWRGVAAYRAGDLQDAASDFGTARAHYNRGTALARDGRYAEALEAYDLAIAFGDADARANFDLIAAYYAGLGIDPETLGLFGKREGDVAAESFIAQGNARAAGTGDEVTNSSTMLGAVQLQSHGEQARVRRIFDDRFMVADRRWLEQLADVPGDYLAARIAHERKRRAALGLAPPDPEDPM